MNEEIKVTDIQMENCHTVVQIDTNKGRIFVELNAILKALNNSIYSEYDKAMLLMGAEHDGKNDGTNGFLEIKKLHD